MKIQLAHKFEDIISVENLLLASGVDFLGWIHFPKHRVLRTKTKRRVIVCLKQRPTNETLVSYLGLLKWGNTKKIKHLIYQKIDL